MIFFPTARESEEEEQILEIVSTTPTPVTLYTNERNEVPTDVTVVFDADYGVNGKDNWEVSLWYSKASDGSGKQTDLDDKTLSRPQRNQPLNIEEPLVFEVSVTGSIKSVYKFAQFPCMS